MNRIAQLQRLSISSAALAVLTGLAWPAAADCARDVHAKDINARSAVEPKVESAVRISDPAIDSVFARYADLHRDAAGYAVSDMVPTSMVAKAASDLPAH